MRPRQPAPGRLALLLCAALPLAAAAGGAKVWHFRDHGEAIFGWAEAARGGELKVPATLVHVDSHADMGMPPRVAGAQSSLELAQRMQINNFIPAAIVLGLVDRVVWVRSEWAVEHPYGRYEYAIAEDETGQSYVSDAPFSEAWGRRPRDVVLARPGARTYGLEVVPLTASALGELQLEPGRYILDLDLDAFDTENIPTAALREEAGLGREEIDRFLRCRCASEGEGCEMAAGVPKEFVPRLKLAPAHLHRVLGDLCLTPVHYSALEEVQAASGMFFAWAEGLWAAGTLPGVVTVSESTNGYLPPDHVEQLRPIVARLAELLGAEAPRWISCSSCVSVAFVNDLKPEAEAELFWQAQGGFPPTALGRIAAGERSNHSSFSGHEFLLRTREGRARSLRAALAYGVSSQEVLLSALAEVEFPGEGGGGAAAPHAEL